MRDRLKRAAATAAIELVEEGMLLGLGTGSTADHVLELLSEEDLIDLLSRQVGVPAATSRTWTYRAQF